MGTIKKVIPGIVSSLPMSPVPESVRPTSVVLANMKVLIAEDNDLMRTVLQKLILGMGVECTATPNGLECFNEYTKTRQEYNLILMDCIMPVMSGFDASEKVRDFERQHKLNATPIVALTATKSESIHQNCLNVGMDDCVIKPVKRQTLIEIFNKYFKKRTREDTPVYTNVELTTSPSLKDSASAHACVLLVEDNAMIAKITQRVLVQSKYKVKHAIHGQEALAMVVADYQEYDVILMDIMMPVMDGIVCTQKIRQFERDRGLNAKPIIALTANPMPGHKNECKAAGCTNYVRKPIDYPSLRTLVAKYCSQNRNSSNSEGDT